MLLREGDREVVIDSPTALSGVIANSMMMRTGSSVLGKERHLPPIAACRSENRSLKSASGALCLPVEEKWWVTVWIWSLVEGVALGETDAIDREDKGVR